MIISHNITIKKIDLKMVLDTLKKGGDLKEKFQIKSLALFGSTVRNEATENMAKNSRFERFYRPCLFFD